MLPHLQAHPDANGDDYPRSLADLILGGMAAPTR